MQRADGTFLAGLAKTAKARVSEGYYTVKDEGKAARRSLVGSLKVEGRNPIIAEVKFRSPSEGKISGRVDPVHLAQAYERGGAAAISVLTEPENFGGSMAYLSAVARLARVPVLMKDVIVDRAQVLAGARAGADAVLLISGVFSLGVTSSTLDEVVDQAHEEGLEVVLEAHNEGEYEAAFDSKADVVGINNRDLGTLSVTIETSERLLRMGRRSKPVICESGIASVDDVARLRNLGADGFLVGTALMKSADPETALSGLVRG